MRKSLVRIVAGTTLALVAVAVTGGIASAAPAAPTPPATTSSDTPIWLLPGVDLGSVLDPTVGIPAEVFAPVDGLLNYIGG
ncbi:MAG TPA: hypothetical protein VG247_35355 [Pseudonocardiaceae bacterium]|jgi:hypothetical protein|nr:hypothetical protein [Pseudonocardiaceae bacterium]